MGRDTGLRSKLARVSLLMAEFERNLWSPSSTARLRQPSLQGWSVRVHPHLALLPLQLQPKLGPRKLRGQPARSPHPWVTVLLAFLLAYPLCAVSPVFNVLQTYISRFYGSPRVIKVRFPFPSVSQLPHSKWQILPTCAAELHEPV